MSSVVADALERTGCGDFADRAISTLAGGEQQRALLDRPSVLLRELDGTA